MQQLKNLKRMMEQNMDRFSQALYDDLHKVSRVGVGLVLFKNGPPPPKKKKKKLVPPGTNFLIQTCWNLFYYEI